jgi:hypothetical protein
MGRTEFPCTPPQCPATWHGLVLAFGHELWSEDFALMLFQDVLSCSVVFGTQAHFVVYKGIYYVYTSLRMGR